MRRNGRGSGAQIHLPRDGTRRHAAVGPACTWRKLLTLSVLRRGIILRDAAVHDVCGDRLLRTVWKLNARQEESDTALLRAGRLSHVRNVAFDLRSVQRRIRRIDDAQLKRIAVR